MIRSNARKSENRRIRLRGLFVAVLPWLVLAPAAQALCYVNEGFTPVHVQLNVGRVVIQPSLPVGGRIALLTYPIQALPDYGQCDIPGGTILARFVPSMTAVSGMSNVYQTDVPGVGVRVYREAMDASNYYPYDLVLGWNWNPTLSLNAGFFQLELIKTAAETGAGPIGSGGLFTTFYADGTGPTRPILTSSLSGSGIVAVTSTCEVQAGSQNIVVNFGSVPTTRFQGVGSRAIDRDFAIHLTCQGGNVAQEDQGLISIRIDATQDSSNAPGVLAITPGPDAASGVGIELVELLNSTEGQVTFGQGIDLGRTQPNASSTLSLPLRARYIQTQAGQVTAGMANGTATFTIEYR